MSRVIAYIDGFNLYFGLRASGWKDVLWLNLQQLARHLLKRGQHLAYTKYFTARVAEPQHKRKRQQVYLEALETLPDFRIFYGKYQLNPRICPRCRYQDRVPNEKMTDVNIAVELLADAFQDMFDTALVISADSDLRGAVETVRKLFPDKRVVMAFPPNRSSKELQAVASAYFTIGRAMCKRSVFPDCLTKSNGYVLHRPAEWR
ncbi:MAG TPA: NYN domain-containing protein [Candidatus Hydrogenedentes bacterium]|nr:NYN domain-containing protein [Candidatus Hydrogenedentota bacterium]HIJ73986.1 NYN domain-containing protein [Candidatus Hydrogenedentota bacterium]